MNFMKVFSIAGMITFTIVSLANLYNLVTFWEEILNASKLSSITMIIFYGILVYVFYLQYKNIKQTENFKKLSENDVDEILSS